MARRRWPRRRIEREYHVVRFCRHCKESRFVATFRSLPDAKQFVAAKRTRGISFKIEGV